MSSLLCPQVYKGYVDDPRNTDNAWIESIAMNFHDDTGSILDDIQLKVCLIFVCFVFAACFKAFVCWLVFVVVVVIVHGFVSF